jgi:hypothetical protein
MYIKEGLDNMNNMNNKYNMKNMKNMFETMMNQNSEEMVTMMDQMPMMREMFNSMFEGGSEMSDTDNNKDGSNMSVELKPLFDDWVNQIKEEVEKYKNENPSATSKEIANYFKLSEQSMAYFMGSSFGAQESNNSDLNFETLKIQKTSNYCSLCEDYVSENDSKPIVILCCEGACLRGEIARKTANIICHSLIPEKTVRLCLGSALTKDGGQRSLVKNAKKIIALEGCLVDCGSRMIRGLSDDIHPEVIRTDVLANFDKGVFGINEMSEEEINKQALLVAKKIIEML